MFKGHVFWCGFFAVVAVSAANPVQGATSDPGQGRSRGENVEQALCRLVESASEARGLPVRFLTRLIWQESSFRTDVISRAGAQGVAQFMPGTARERGLADPFDPEQAIPAAAALLSDLRQQFGNLGLAAAAYNSGPGRVSAWIQGKGGLPAETRDYVLRITGRPAEEWAAPVKAATAEEPVDLPPQTCLQVTAGLRSPTRPNLLVEAALAPWGVQLAGNFSKEVALASYARARQSYAAIIGDVQPLIIGTRLRSRGSRPFYRVRVPAQTRAAANALCDRIRAANGSCVTLRS
jgi:hypothetical protein